MRFVSTSAGLSLIFVCRAIAASVPQAEIDRIVRPYLDKYVCGVVVGIVDEDGRRVFGYGSATDNPRRVPDGRTVFEIGSISKVFTGLLLAQGVQRGEVKLDDPVQKHLPAGVRMPPDGGQPITLLMLSTHHSGLPRMPGNFRPKDTGNPYADYSVQQMYEFLGTCKLQSKPGEKHEYSNLGTGLLGHALALAAGRSYEQILVERICRPLDMGDTKITLDDSMRQRLAQGHTLLNLPTSNWDIPTLAGAGAIRSTADDMLKFLSAELGLTKTDLSEAIAQSQAHRMGSGGSAMALGWIMNQRQGIWWHNGETGGYHSFAAIVPQKRIAVVVLSNTATKMVDELGDNVLRLMLGMNVPTPTPGSPPTRPAARPTTAPAPSSGGRR